MHVEVGCTPGQPGHQDGLSVLLVGPSPKMYAVILSAARVCAHCPIVSYLQNKFKDIAINDSFFKTVFTFRKRGREGEREGEKYQCERETSISCLLYAP